MNDFLNRKHQHRYYFQTVKKEFEPIDPASYEDIEQFEGLELYRMVEYAISMCNCTHAIKVRVEKGSPENVQ